MSLGNLPSWISSSCSLSEKHLRRFLDAFVRFHGGIVLVTQETTRGWGGLDAALCLRVPAALERQQWTRQISPVKELTC